MVLGNGRGRKDWRLSAEERADARRAFELLDGSGLSLESAARLALRLSPEGAVDRVSVDDAADRYLRELLGKVTAGEMRESTYTYYEENLGAFRRSFGARAVDDLERTALEGYFEGLPVARSTAHGRWRAVRAFLRWCARQSPPLIATGKPPALGVNFAPARNEGEVRVLTPEQTAKVMAGAGEYAPALALVFFAGVRIGEVRGSGKPPLTWGAVNTRERMIRVPAECAKSRRARILERLPANIWSFLRAGAKEWDPEEPICPWRPRQAIRAARIALDGADWPKNAHRHSFASYHLALHNDPGRLAVLMGHEDDTTMLYRHYRGVVTREAAKKYFGICQV